MVVVNYEGKNRKGKVFDSSYERNEPAEFPLNRVIKGWTEGMKLVGKGGKINAWMPSSAAYGSAGDKELGIKPNATLYYEIELVDLDKYTNWSRRNNLRR